MRTLLIQARIQRACCWKPSSYLDQIAEHPFIIKVFRPTLLPSTLSLRCYAGARRRNLARPGNFEGPLCQKAEKLAGLRSSVAGWDDLLAAFLAATGVGEVTRRRPHHKQPTNSHTHMMHPRLHEFTDDRVYLENCGLNVLVIKDMTSPVDKTWATKTWSCPINTQHSSHLRST